MITSCFFGGAKEVKTGVKTIFLGEVETAVRLGMKPRVGDVA